MAILPFYVCLISIRQMKTCFGLNNFKFSLFIKLSYFTNPVSVTRNNYICTILIPVEIHKEFKQHVQLKSSDFNFVNRTSRIFHLKLYTDRGIRKILAKYSEEVTLAQNLSSHKLTLREKKIAIKCTISQKKALLNRISTITLI